MCIQNPKRGKVRASDEEVMPAASEVLRHNLLILVGLPSLIRLQLAGY